MKGAVLSAGQRCHATGEHTESSEAVALLAYIHDRLGYTEMALKALERLRADRPGDSIAAAALATVSIDRGGTVSAADEAASRNWPRPSFEEFPIGSRRVLADGTRGSSLCVRLRRSVSEVNEKRKCSRFRSMGDMH